MFPKYLVRNIMVIWFFATLIAAGFFSFYGAVYCVFLAVLDANIVLEADRMGL